MAVNEKIVTEKAYRIWNAVDGLWHKISFWNKASDTECEDGTTVETKVGAIKGITTSTNVTEEGYAADAKTVSEINQSLSDCLKSVADGKALLAGSISSYVTTASDASFDTINTNMQSAFQKSFNTGYGYGVTDADNRANANSTNYKTGYNNGYNAGYSAGQATNYKVKQGSVNVGAADENWHSITINTGLSSISYYQVKGYVPGNTNGNANNITSSSVSGGYITVRVYARQYCSNMVDYLAVGK